MGDGGGMITLQLDWERNKNSQLNRLSFNTMSSEIFI